LFSLPLLISWNQWDAWVFHAWLAANGGTFLSNTGDPLFNSSAGRETMTFLQNLVKDGYTLPCQLDDLSPWYSGKVAIAVNGPWHFPDLVKFTNFKFTVVPYPLKTQPATNIGGDQLFIFNINNDSQKVASSFNYAQ
jgi:ABC-type glycerol-3-phosphate transport system substrate-binding protein